MAETWDDSAATFDDEADHGLRDPRVRAAWAALLVPLMPEAPATVVDLGCGTGSLAVLLAGAGHRVRGLDSSPRMLEIARAKSAAAGVDVELLEGNAADPPFEAASADVVLCRHVLWALDDRDAVMARWVRLLRPGGRLVLIEGVWTTGVGLPAAECRELVLRHRPEATVRELSGETALWGRTVEDERYLLYS
ncbi:MAG: class I SAM-dependent methyltransferase [Blastococcus sp.]